MQNINIAQTEYSPAVTYNPETKEFIFAGESRPENCGKFYAPVIDWLTNFETILSANTEEKASTLVFIFKFDYFNSTSARYIMNILQCIKRIESQKKHTVKVEWYYEKLDEDMLEAGKEFSEVVDLEFSFKEL